MKPWDSPAIQEQEAGMTNLEDFTRFPVGCEVPLGGRVEICPACGRNGIPERRVCGDPRFVHRQVSVVFADGMRTDPLEACTLGGN